MTDNKMRINQIGKSLIQGADKIIICNFACYSTEKLNTASKLDKNAYIALVLKAGSYSQPVYAGNLRYWVFNDIKNAIRSIKRIRKDVPISVFSDDEITKLVLSEKLEMDEFLEAARKFNAGEKTDLIEILKKDLINTEKNRGH